MWAHSVAEMRTADIGTAKKEYLDTAIRIAEIAEANGIMFSARSGSGMISVNMFFDTYLMMEVIIDDRIYYSVDVFEDLYCYETRDHGFTTIDFVAQRLNELKESVK